MTGILELHRPDFPPAERPVAPPPPRVDTSAILRRHQKAALAGIGVFNRAGRNQAKAAAEAATTAEVIAITENDRRLHAEHQHQLDYLWSRLLNNDPEVVLGMLAEAFEDNEASAAPVGVSGSEVSLVVLVPSPASVPERKPATTPAGNLTLKKLTKREHADFYKLMVCGFTLTTVKEAFAVAPGLTHVRIVALRTTGPDAYGRPHADAIMAARFSRQSLDAVQWQIADASRIVNDTSEQITVRQVGPSKELGPLDLAINPDIASLLAAVDLSELAG